MSELNLIEAVTNGDRSAVETLIRNGADVNQQDDQGWTPLNFAAGKGDLGLVKLLVENGAEIFKVGRDRRTPYMIALAAGRVSVVKYLRDVEERYPGEKPVRLTRKYCKAYHLRDLREYEGWSESRINWKEKKDNGNSAEPPDPHGTFSEDKVVFIHQDFTVTESVWHSENVIFQDVDEAWKEFCSTALGFKVPDDLDLIVPHESETQGKVEDLSGQQST
jgi:uncharacterized protein